MNKVIFFVIILFFLSSCSVPQLDYYPKEVKSGTQIEKYNNEKKKIVFKAKELTFSVRGYSAYNYIHLVLVVNNYSLSEYEFDLTKCYITDSNGNITKVYVKYLIDKKTILKANRKTEFNLGFIPDTYIEKFALTFSGVKDIKSNEEVKLDIVFEAKHDEFIKYVEKYATSEMKEKIFRR